MVAKQSPNAEVLHFFNIFYHTPNILTMSLHYTVVIKNKCGAKCEIRQNLLYIADSLLAAMFYPLAWGVLTFSAFPAPGTGCTAARSVYAVLGR